MTKSSPQLARQVPEECLGCKDLGARLVSVEWWRELLQRRPAFQCPGRTDTGKESLEIPKPPPVEGQNPFAPLGNHGQQLFGGICSGIRCFRWLMSCFQAPIASPEFHTLYAYTCVHANSPRMHLANQKQFLRSRKNAVLRQVSQSGLCIYRLATRVLTNSLMMEEVVFLTPQMAQFHPILGSVIPFILPQTNMKPQKATVHGTKSSVSYFSRKTCAISPPKWFWELLCWYLPRKLRHLHPVLPA